MAFIDRISEDLVAAMRAKDTLRLGACGWPRPR